MKDKRYWFVTYEIPRPGHLPPQRLNTVIDKHPVDWMIEVCRNSHQVVVTFYRETSKEAYNAYQKHRHKLR